MRKIFLLLWLIFICVNTFASVKVPVADSFQIGETVTDSVRLSINNSKIRAQKYSGSSWGNYSIDSSDIIYIDSMADLYANSTVSGNELRLQGYKIYKSRSDLPIILNYILVPGPRTTINNWVITTPYSVNLDSLNGLSFDMERSQITYVGTGNVFEATDAAGGVVRIVGSNIIAPTGTHFSTNTTDPNSLFILDNVVILYGNIGTVQGSGFLATKVRSYLNTGGIKLVNNYQGFQFEGVEMKSWQNVTGSVMIDVRGTTAQGSFFGVYAEPKSNEYIFNISPTLNYGGIVCNGSPISLLQSGVDSSNIFKPGSLTQKNIGIKFSGNANIPNSTIRIECYVTGNSSISTINTINVPVTMSITQDINYIIDPERISISTANETITATYIGAEDSSITIETKTKMHAGAAAKTLSSYIAKNGVLPENIVVKSSEISSTSGAPKTAVTNYDVDVVTGDEINFKVANNSDGLNSITALEFLLKIK